MQTEDISREYNQSQGQEHHSRQKLLLTVSTFMLIDRGKGVGELERERAAERERERELQRDRNSPGSKHQTKVKGCMIWFGVS